VIPSSFGVGRSVPRTKDLLPFGHEGEEMVHVGAR